MKGNNTYPRSDLRLRTRASTALAALGTAALLLCTHSSQASVFLGNGNSGFGGTIGNGSLTLTDDGTTISGTLSTGGNMNDALVIYIQTGTGSSFADTSSFSDNGDGLRTAISGYNGTQRSLMTFANGFRPTYAIALGPNNANFGGVWQLAAGGANSLPYVTTVNLTPTGTATGPFTFSFPASAIGLTPGVKTNILIFGTYISNSGYRSTEAIAGNDTGTQGWNPFTQTSFGTYTFDAGATTSYPVTFSVDMTQQIAIGAFQPGSGDTVYVAGTFDNPPFSGTQLTVTANPNIYSGTVQDANPVGTAEAYKFRYHSVAYSSDTYEDSDNRPFTQQSGGQTLPTVYFADLAPAQGTNALTFQIDLTPQIQLGHFTPGVDAIEVLGTFTTPGKWTEGVFALTNNPNGPKPNLYTGTYPDGNYSGSYEQYKFVIAAGGVGGTLTYENGNNRTFTTPAGPYTFPVAYFNNITNAYSIPVTFAVDMTSQAYAKTFNLANGDTVAVAGTFQNPTPWVVGSGPGVVVLTNNPSGSNPNLFTGTYIVKDQPGTSESYKFIINTNGGGTAYESPVSTGGNDRNFTLAASAQTLPKVFWSDLNPGDVLSVDTWVTFTVNMTNAVDRFGYPFDPANDAIVINGDFLQPQWPGALWTDPNPPGDYPNLVLTNDPPTGSALWSSVPQLVPAGHSLQINYKYGIAHNLFGVGGNTNADNEAGFAQNHTRYIRALGQYTMPLDLFGIQQTNPAAAIEPSFGNLSIGRPAAGHIPVTWLGRPGVHLQTKTNLIGTWEDHPETDGLSATNWPFAGPTRYFRLIKP